MVEKSIREKDLVEDPQIMFSFEAQKYVIFILERLYCSTAIVQILCFIFSVEFEQDKKEVISFFI